MGVPGPKTTRCWQKFNGKPCNGEMRVGRVIRNPVIAHPDFPGDKAEFVEDMSPEDLRGRTCGPVPILELVRCMKCVECGHSFVA